MWSTVYNDHLVICTHILSIWLLSFPFICNFIYIILTSRHELNFFLQQTLGSFFKDMIKGTAVSIVVGPPIVATIIVIAQVLLSTACLHCCSLYVSVLTLHFSIWLWVCHPPGPPHGNNALVVNLSINIYECLNAERRSLPGYISLGVHMCSVSCNNGTLSNSDRPAFQQVHSCK